MRVRERRAVQSRAGSSGVAPKRSSTLVPSAAASASATSSEGDQRPDSIPEIDWRVTPAMSASAPWDKPRARRASRKRSSTLWLPAVISPYSYQGATTGGSSAVRVHSVPAPGGWSRWMVNCSPERSATVHS